MQLMHQEALNTDSGRSVTGAGRAEEFSRIRQTKNNPRISTNSNVPVKEEASTETTPVKIGKGFRLFEKPTVQVEKEAFPETTSLINDNILRNVRTQEEFQSRAQQRATMDKALKLIHDDRLNINLWEDVDKQMEEQIPGWSDLSIPDRTTILNRYLMKIESNLNEELEEKQMEHNRKINKIQSYNEYNRRQMLG